MSEEKEQDWRSAVHVIALDVEKAAVLLYENGDGSYHLPTFTAEGGRWETTTANMQEQIGPTLKIEGQVLYQASYTEDEESCRGEAVVIMDTEAPSVLEGSWFTVDTLGGIRLAEPAFLPLMERALDELEPDAVPAMRPSWARPGWYQESADWLTAEVTKAGWLPSGPIEPGKSWCLSYVMRVPAAKGGTAEPRHFYFKTSLDLPLFVNEAVVTDKLAALYTGQVPRPLAIDAGRDWMVLEDFGPLIGHGAPLEDRLEILRQYAVIQLKSTEEIDNLLSIGCCDRRLDWMASQIELLYESPETKRLLSPEELERLGKMVGPLQRMCRALADYEVPDALIHGDLHGSNVAGKRGTTEPLIFFDWTDSAVSHPFFDMLIIFIEKNTAEQEQMRDLYLSYWVDYEPMERLLEIWQIAEVLAAVYHSISYASILENVEAWGKNDLDWALPYWIGKILAKEELIHEY